MAGVSHTTINISIYFSITVLLSLLHSYFIYYRRRRCLNDSQSDQKKEM